MYAATGGQNVKWGGTDFKWGVGHHCPPPAGDGPGCHTRDLLRSFHAPQFKNPGSRKNRELF